MLDTCADGKAVATAEATPRGAADTLAMWRAVRLVFDEGTALQERTFKWLATLPGAVRPMATARRHPRIVNRIGDLWAHCEYTRLNFQRLLNDRRGGRRGFPAAIRQELEGLQQYYFENLSGLPAVLWNAVPIAEPKLPARSPAPVSRSAEIEILALPAY